jgi:hypothetical protein
VGKFIQVIIIIKYDMVIFNYRVLVRSFRGEVSTETTKFSFSFLALFEVRISCDVLDISNDSGRFRDPLPTISTALLPSRTRRFLMVRDLDFPWILLSVHAA